MINLKLKFALVSLLTLGACQPAMFHEPTLKSKPADQVKYKNDLNDCREAARPSSSTSNKIMLFGPLFSGFAMDSKEYDRATTPTTELVDTCMEQKGYSVIINQ